ncbi:universal stress protein [Synechocystis salina]|uniref:Universal stress protein n=1 Tax=Synechocystis salina LEGE 00031 TaxID=1828736 RepID=A0ABR9VNW4_9SYNC|nr:universal stress protein [Synechocystis salina LEGE 00041]MBE9253017.1 universal stress protein [Synechocystis salina LEGE 00031]
MKNILLCTDGSDFAQQSYPYAAWLASKLGGNIKVLYVTDIRAQKAVESVNLSGSIGLGTSEELLKQLVDLEHTKAKLNHQKAKLLLATAKNALQQVGIESVQVMHKTGFLLDCLEDLKGDFDVIILGKRGETAKFAQGHLGANMERIIRSIPKPCLVTPKQFQTITKVLFAYDGSASCQKILQFLTISPLLADLPLHIVTVGKTNHDTQAIANLGTAEKVLERAGFKPQAELLVGHAEEAIVRYQEDNAIDLLLMGAHGHSRIRHLVIGSTTAQVLRKTSIPVLTFR